MYFLNVLCFTLGTQISTHIHVNFSPTDLLFRITERILEVISPIVCVWVFPPFFFSVIPVIMIYRYQNVCVLCVRNVVSQLSFHRLEFRDYC
jgi:hypothetical protein